MTVVSPRIDDKVRQIGIRGSELLPEDHGLPWVRTKGRFGQAGVPKVDTHGIRHRSATDIANSGIPVKAGMALTAHKTVGMFMRYVDTEDDPVRQAAELVAKRRKAITNAQGNVV